MFMPVANGKYIGGEDQVFLCGLLWDRLVVFRRAELYDIHYKGMKSKTGRTDKEGSARYTCRKAE